MRLDRRARVNILKDTDAVTVGIDAAVVANHHVIVRRPEPGGVGEVVDDFVVPPTLDGLARLTDRLARRQVSLAVAEPTSMTWLGLSIALADAGSSWRWSAAAMSPGCVARCRASTSRM